MKKEPYILNFLSDSNVQISTLIILLVFYIITRNPWFGVITLLSMISFLVIEFYVGSKNHGIKKEIVETLIAFGFAFLLWYGLTFLLNTSSPISAVVSCSMVDSINRGDLIIIKGENTYQSKEIEVEENDIDSLNKIEANMIYKGNEYKIKGSIFSYCQGSYSNICNEFRKNPKEFNEVRGNFEFHYSLCTRKSKDSSIELKEPCLTSISYKGKEYRVEKSGDVVVYIPKKEDLFFSLLNGGDIIHRAIFKLKTKNATYYITKGDNNNVADFQFYSKTYGRKNSIVNEEQVKGKMIAKIPFLGYYKLFLIGSFEEGNFCSFVLE